MLIWKILKMSRLQHKKGRKSNYSKTLNNEVWREVRLRVIARDRCCKHCGSRLYLEVHQPALATPPDASTQAILDMGTDVGEWARRLFEDGRLVEAGYRQTEAALTQTAALMADRRVPAIFEAAIMAGGVLIRVDVLERVTAADGNLAGWREPESLSDLRCLFFWMSGNRSGGHGPKEVFTHGGPWHG